MNTFTTERINQTLDVFRAFLRGERRAPVLTVHSALTYRQAEAAANQVAHALLARGLERGDVVLLFCENSVEAYLAKIGIAKAGLVAAPLNPMMAPDLVAAMIDPKRAGAIIAGGFLAGVVMYGCYAHAKKAGLASSEPGTESW